MYTDYFNFQEEPFNITSDPDYFFASPKHTEAREHVFYGIENRKGIILVTGEIGTGKTTLCRTILNTLPPHVKRALVLNPTFSEIQLIKTILKDFGLKPKGSKYDLIDQLNDFLIEETNQGHNVVIFIDEAQNLGIKQLEQVRLLSNLETEKHKLLQIVLMGQPELCDKLKLEELRQVNQRISVRYHILPLTLSEMKEYIEHRLEVASAGQASVEFTPESFETLFEVSKGTPRMINLICDRSLLSAFTQEKRLIEKSHIIQSAREVVVK